ncbi:MAG: tetratricopeptide repeat protein [Nitrospirae bacterium]|nr:tetratricopeptide repeat protein [Nitrospirota bacterium]
MNEQRYQIFIRIKNSKLRYRAFFVCVLYVVFCILFFSACATVKDTEKTKQAEAYNKMGDSYLSSGKPTEAYTEFQKAILLDPKNIEALNRLGYISALFRKYNEAISFYKRAITADPNFSEAMNNLGVVYLEVENWDEAVKYFRAALNNPLYRSPEKAYLSMGYAYYKKGEYPKAEDSIKEALLRSPVFPMANYTLGLVYVKNKDDRAAIEEYKKAIGIMSDYMDAHWELANAYLRTGEKDKALKHFRIIAEKDSDIKRSREALEIIESLK